MNFLTALIDCFTYGFLWNRRYKTKDVMPNEIKAFPMMLKMPISGRKLVAKLVDSIRRMIRTSKHQDSFCILYKEKAVSVETAFLYVRNRRFMHAEG